jgi:hypothetical protein
MDGTIFTLMLVNLYNQDSGGFWSLKRTSFEWVNACNLCYWGHILMCKQEINGTAALGVNFYRQWITGPTGNFHHWKGSYIVRHNSIFYLHGSLKIFPPFDNFVRTRFCSNFFI